MKLAKSPEKTDGFSLIFYVTGRFWGSENSNKSINVGLRGNKNETKRGQERLRERKMRQDDAQGALAKCLTD